MLGRGDDCREALADCHAALGEAEARFRTLLEHAPEAVVVLDADAGKFVEANQNAAALFELPRESLLDSDPVALSPPVQPGGAGSPELARQRIEEALAGGTPAFEWIHRTRSGTPLSCEVRLVRLPAAGRRLVRGSITEIGRRRRLEQQVLQWQKVEMLGQLAGGIAHDLNNVLMAISASAEALRVEPPEQQRIEADWICEAVGRGARLTRRLLGFLRSEDTPPARVDLNLVLSDVGELLGRLLPGQIAVELRLAAEAYAICDRRELEQVLMNLMLNASDAMPQGGTITLSTRQERGEVRLRVEDTGVGMSDTTRRRMFEAFFSTKPVGKGTGLGLAIVQANVQRAGGWISVASAPGQGTRVDVYLPAG